MTEHDVLDALDRFRSEYGNDMDRADAIRTILKDWLISHGYLIEGVDEEISSSAGEEERASAASDPESAFNLTA